MAYRPGDPLFWCPVCRMNVYYSDTVKDGYDPNKRVCKDCYDPPVPKPRLHLEKIAAPNPSPDPDDITYTAEADADGVCLLQSPTAAGILTINGALARNDAVFLAVRRKVTITAVGNESARTFTVAGKNSANCTITEEITGPNATIATGTEDYRVITQISIDAASAGNITVGVAAG